MNQKVFKRRVYSAGFLFAILCVVYLSRLVTLHFSGKIVAPDKKKSDIHRGFIKDRNGYILALSIERNSLFANPEEIAGADETARVLAPILRVSPESIRDRLKKKKRFIWLRRMLDDATAAEIRKMGLRGLYFKKEYQRVYPHDGLAANILGFVGIDGTGLAGIEYSMNDTLSGGDDGLLGADEGFGPTVNLTIDRFIQHIAEREIAGAVKLYRARQGVVLVMEVRTGRVLALAKYPGFDPNQYYAGTSFALRNFSVIDSFEPGSTMKIFSMASLMEHNPAAAGALYTCNGFIDIADVRINCTGIHGKIPLNDIIKYSCNVGVIESMKALKKKDLYDTLAKFRFGIRSGLDLPGETDGILRPTGKWSGLSKYSIAIGQEISVTSLQMAAAYCAVANGGEYIAPTIVDSVVERGGRSLRRSMPARRERIIKKELAARLLKMMRGVVAGGTGSRAESHYYCVAGKTGTSQKFIRAKGYSDRVLSSFVGVAPCDRPEVCVLVVIDDPADKLSGGQIATPVFAAVIDSVLSRLGISNRNLDARAPVRRKVIGPDFDGKSMPDFRGMGVPESLKLLVRIKKKSGARFAIQGTGRVHDQRPAPGAKIDDSTGINLYFRE